MDGDMATLLRLAVRRIGLPAALFFSVLCLSGCASLFFLPQSQWLQNPANQGLAYEDVVLIHADGERVHGWWLPAEGTVRGTVYFLHGNAENISTHLLSVQWLPARGFNVLLVDYRGYGLSDGKASVRRASEDVQLGLDWLRGSGRLGGDPLIVFGQSLGGSLAIPVLAAEKNHGRYDCLIAEAPFAGYRRIVSDVMRRQWLLWGLRPLLLPWQPGGPDPIDHIGSLRAPLLLLHSRADQVVPFSHAELLLAQAPAASQLEEVSGGHIAALRHDPVRDRLIDFIEAACRAGYSRPAADDQPADVPARRKLVF